MAKRPDLLDPSNASTVVELAGEDVALKEGGEFPIWARVIFHWPSLPDSPRVVLNLAVVDGQVIVSSFGCLPPRPEIGINLTQVHSMPLGAFRDAAVRWTWATRTGQQWDTAAAEGGKFSEEDIRGQWRSRQSALTSSRRRRDVTDERLQLVAEIYNSDTSGKPTEAVAKAEFTSHRNAGRLISQARDRGYIAPVSKRSPSRQATTPRKRGNQ